MLHTVIKRERRRKSHYTALILYAEYTELWYDGPSQSPHWKQCLRPSICLWLLCSLPRINKVTASRKIHKIATIFWPILVCNGREIFSVPHPMLLPATVFHHWLKPEFVQYSASYIWGLSDYKFKIINYDISIMISQWSLRPRSPKWS